MINVEKVQLMTRSAMFEQGSRNEDLKLKVYFSTRKGGLRLRNAAWGAAVYILFISLILLAIIPDIPALKDNVPVAVIIIAGTVILGAAFTVIFTRFSMQAYRKRYRNTRSSFVRYDLIKKKLKTDPQSGKTEKVSAE